MGKYPLCRVLRGNHLKKRELQREEFPFIVPSALKLPGLTKSAILRDILPGHTAGVALSIRARQTLKDSIAYWIGWNLDHRIAESLVPVCHDLHPFG
jgi:hypothetical protein